MQVCKHEILKECCLVSVTWGTQKSSGLQIRSLKSRPNGSLDCWALSTRITAAHTESLSDKFNLFWYFVSVWAPPTQFYLDSTHSSTISRVVKVDPSVAHFIKKTMAKVTPFVHYVCNPRDDQELPFVLVARCRSLWPVTQVGFRLGGANQKLWRGFFI